MQPYSNTAKTLHWLVAGLIVSQYILAKLSEIAKDNDEILNQLAILANHKSIGITILLLAIVRLVHRLRHTPPPLPQTMPRWQQLASNASHALLYGFLFALPITGWLMSSAKAYSVSWFNLFPLPDLIAPSETWYSLMHDAHHWLGEALLILAVIHVAAALKHHFFDRDTVLKRMSSKLGWWILAGSILLCVVVFGRVLSTNTAPNGPDTSAPSSSTNSINQPAPQATETENTQSTLAAWLIDYPKSYIRFTGDQAGAAFTGEWQQWQATIRFDKDTLAQSRFEVEIDPASADSGDQERDQTIATADFFDATNHPKATFQATEFNTAASGYRTLGTLTMKGINKPLDFVFNVTQEQGTQVLTGSAKIDRLAWNIGTGDWRDTSWVGQDVNVEVRVQTQVESN
ncbi:YceI family protein [Arenicella xantha]|uniref:Cytochrome b561 n=1 Tax=Arenicella xantha TaxID=644221 RepID=A0A395JSU6_9GAMM|nr:YceI family protein [Arenicella xantha]RBP53615.1 cytochrome b561 [Arenicella xantha]